VSKLSAFFVLVAATGTKVLSSIMTDTPWKRRDARQRSKRSEEEVGRLPGGKKQVNSGRTPFSRRDAKLNEFLLEVRDTDNDTYKLSRKEFEQVVKDALMEPPGYLGGMRISLQGYPLIVMREKDYLAFKGRIDASGNNETEPDTELS
jgi:hypothetical protein